MEMMNSKVEEKLKKEPKSYTYIIAVIVIVLGLLIWSAMSIKKGDDVKDSMTIAKNIISGILHPDLEFLFRLDNKGVSVGYSIDTWEEVKAGKESTDGFAGPCYIARKWTPYEISIVSIPADGTVGVGRSEENTDGKDMADLSMYENIVKMNENKLRL